MTQLTISEIFGPTLQGEGHLIGVQTVFVRTGGCDYRCRWCDTLYAVDPKFNASWTKHSSAQVFEQIELLSGNTPLWVTLSGGNPALQDCAELIEMGHAKGYRFCMETQGSVVKPWFHLLDHLTLSPKPPSSGMHTDYAKLTACVNSIAHDKLSFKIVIADKDDLLWARELANDYAHFVFYLQPCHPIHEEAKWQNEDALQAVRDLHQWVTALQWNEARILPQMHLLLWGGERGF